MDDKNGPWRKCIICESDRLTYDEARKHYLTHKIVYPNSQQPYRNLGLPFAWCRTDKLGNFKYLHYYPMYPVGSNTKGYVIDWVIYDDDGDGYRISTGISNPDFTVVFKEITQYHEI